MVFRREYIIGTTKGVVVATGLAFSTHVVMETYMHDSQRVHHPLHAPGSIVVAPTSVATLVALDSMLVTLIPDNLEYTSGAVTKDLVKDLNVTARQQAWIPPTVK